MKRILLFLLLAGWSCLSIFASDSKLVQPGNARSLKRIQHGVLIAAEQGKMMIQQYASNVIRVRLARQDFEPGRSYAVITKPQGDFETVHSTPEGWELTTDSLIVKVYKSPLRLAFLKKDGAVLSEDYPEFPYTWQGTQVSCHRTLFGNEHFVGLGEKTGRLDKRGSSFVNWNSDQPGYSLTTDPLYQSVPFFIGIHEPVVYGIFMDNSYRTVFDFAASTDDRFSWFSADDGEMDYYFFGSSTIPGIIDDYTTLTGKMTLPPLWSLGYQQCRWGYYPDSEFTALAKKFREKKIPCDVLYLDIDYMDHYKVFTWSPEKFPQPASMLNDLKAMGFHVATIIDPGIKIEKDYHAYETGILGNHFIKYPGGGNYIGSVWPGRCHFPDFTSPETRHWWGKNFSALVDPGVEGFWNDMNEPSAWGQNIPDFITFSFEGEGAMMDRCHNLYGLAMSKATYEGTRKLMNGRRPFILTRAGFAGIQRYSAVWTGDNISSDDHMIISARMITGLGLSGISFTGADVGGFINSPSKELFIRWLSMSVFSPLMRNHSAVDTRDQEPWAFGEEVEAQARSAIEMRYRLLPYIYSAFYESTQNGMPVARSLVFEEPFNNKIYSWEYQNEYLFGDALLVIPVSSTQQFAKALFPKGRWYRYTTGEVVEGPSETLVEAYLSDMPVYVRESSMIPLQQVVQSTSENPGSTLEWNIYEGSRANSFVYYEDDGVTYDFETGAFHKRELRYIPADKKLILGKAEGNYKSRYTIYDIKYYSKTGLKNIRINVTDEEQAVNL